MLVGGVISTAAAQQFRFALLLVLMRLLACTRAAKAF